MFKYSLRVIRYILVILITAISLPTSSFGATLTLLVGKEIAVINITTI